MKAWIVLEYDLEEDGDTAAIDTTRQRIVELLVLDGSPVPNRTSVADSMTVYDAPGPPWVEVPPWS